MAASCVHNASIALSVPLLGCSTPDSNTSAKVSRHEWKAHGDTNWWCIYSFLSRGGILLLKDRDRNRGGVLRCFSKVSGSGVDFTLLKEYTSLAIIIVLICIILNKAPLHVVDLHYFCALFCQWVPTLAGRPQ